MHRLSGHAPGEIVQGNFDRRFGAVIAVHAAVHGGQCSADVGGIAAAHGRAEIVHRRYNALECLAGVHRRGRCFSPTDYPGVACNAYQDRIGAADFLARHDDGLEHRQADGNRLDGCDGHAWRSAYVPSS